MIKEKHVVNGLLHRVDGPAIIYTNGTQVWYHNGEIHREDGPAITWGDTKVYANHGYLHNINGPTVICRQHGFHNQYFLYGYKVDKKLFDALIENYDDETIFKFEVLVLFKDQERHKVDDYYFG